MCLQDYISQFKFQSVVAQDLIDFFLGYFPELKDAAVSQREGEDNEDRDTRRSVTSLTSLPVYFRSRV